MFMCPSVVELIQTHFNEKSVPEAVYDIHDSPRWRSLYSEGGNYKGMVESIFEREDIVRHVAYYFKPSKSPNKAFISISCWDHSWKERSKTTGSLS